MGFKGWNKHRKCGLPLWLPRSYLEQVKINYPIKLFVMLFISVAQNILFLIIQGGMFADFTGSE